MSNLFKKIIINIQISKRTVYITGILISILFFEFHILDTNFILN